MNDQIIKRIEELKKKGQLLLAKKRELVDNLNSTDADLMKLSGAIEELSKLVQNEGEEKNATK